MSKHYLKKGELKKKAHLYETIPNMLLLAASDDNDWSQIEIVTLKQHAIDQANEEAWRHTPLTLKKTENLANSLVKTFSKTKEFVLVREDDILVGVDSDAVDDAAVDKALLMLIEMDSFEIGTCKFFNVESTNEDTNTKKLQ